ncbi:MAG: hypothetical protein ACRC7C_14445 [Beijerinckiaceae bacterium]
MNMRSMRLLELKVLRVSKTGLRDLQRRAKESPRLAAAIQSGRIEGVAARRGLKRSAAQRERRARRTGVLVRGYHGSNEAFSRVKPGKLGSNTDRSAARAAFFMTSDPRQARDYARLAARRGGGRAQIMRTSARLRKPRIIDGGGREIGDAVPSRAFGALIDDARRAGHDGIIFRNVRDAPGALSKVRPATVVAVINHQAVRASKRRRRRGRR